MLLSKIGPLIT